MGFFYSFKRGFTITKNLNNVISDKSFLAEQDVCLYTHTKVSESSQVPECGIAPRARLLSATTVHWQKRNGHYTEIAYQLRGSVQGGLQAQPAAGPQLGTAQILAGNLAARRISKWELKGIDISATHCKEKCQTTAETKPKEEKLKRSTREQFEALSEEFTHHRAGQNSCCG